MQLTKNQKGFTLMELLIVIVVLGVLAGVALPVYSGFVDRAKKAEALGMLDAVRSSEMRYYAEWEAYTANLAALDFNPNTSVGGQNLRYKYEGTITTGGANFRIDACLPASTDCRGEWVAKATPIDVTLR